ADAMYQYAARWGSTKVPDENLKLAKNQKKQSGMNLITTIEDWNEQDATWLMRRAYFTPFEYAAMCSADYDGHCGTMGKTVGAKNADPNIDFAMSGLAGCGTQYIHAMNFWFKYNRKDGKFAADTLNFHIYANSSGSTQYQTGETEGMCFEKTTVPSTLQSVMNYRDAYLPDKKVMISEFGWDTNIESPQGVREFGSLTAQIVQAQWMMRAYMINFSLGIDESQMYMLRDVGTGNGKYATCGLVTQKPQTEKEVQTRKTSWYYLYAMKNALKDMKFVKRVDMGDPDLWVFQFQNSAGNKAYAVWSGTQEDRKLPKVTIPLEGGNQYTMVEMKNDPETDKITTTGLYTPIKAENNAYVIPWVTETPIFLLEGDHKVPVAPVWQDGDDVTSERVSDDKVKINWSTAKSDIDIMYYTIYLNDKKYTSISGKENSMLLPFDDKTAYSVKIFAGDTCGQETVEPLYASKPVDFYKPSKPRNISLLMASSNKISLQWEEPTDNYDVPGSISYRMYDKEKNLVAEGKSTHLVADKLSASTEYTFTVTAVDAAGNESEPSKSITVSTTKGDLPLWALIVIISLSVLILALAIISAIIYMRKNGGFKNSMKKLSQKFAHGKNGHKEAVEIPDSVSISESIYSNSEDEAKKEGDADGDTSIAQ
ncbi:MAG: fibronectin type III domain-containing protein, partial [Oscillospiraceae bacterium]